MTSKGLTLLMNDINSTYAENQYRLTLARIGFHLFSHTCQCLNRLYAIFFFFLAQGRGVMITGMGVIKSLLIVLFLQINI